MIFDILLINLMFSCLAMTMLMDYSYMQKSLITFLLHTFAWSSFILLGNGTSSDIYCLRSIKESMEDPFNYISSSWNFNKSTTEGFICKFTGIECWSPLENKVLYIRLANMGLKGQFPRGIKNCTSLLGIDFSCNKLSGPIPFDICEMLPYITKLHLSFNNFSGEIPSNIGNCTYLNVLKLDNNRLTGQIPSQLGLLNRIKSFSVANNLLSGPLPNFVNAPTVTNESYANNLGLCGIPFEACKGTAPKIKKDHNLFRSGYVVGYLVALVWVIYIGVMWFCIVRVPAKKIMSRKHKKKKKEAFQSQCPTAKERISMDIKISTLEHLVTRMNFTELNQATDNFSEENIIAAGKMGTMYKAMIPNGWFLAIKRCHDSEHVKEQFVSELMTLGRLRHRNLAPLLGFCLEMEERLLVYTYMSNGNLYDWLHPLEVQAKFMEWPLRVKIAVGLARGLAWLHHNCNIRLAHCNISLKCILLDLNFEPKISNFGGAMFMNRASSRNFVNVESWELGSVEKDVYSFGIVLLELITGEEPNKVTNSSKSFRGTLVEWITHLSTSSSGLYDAVNKLLIGQGFDGEIFQFLRVACNCVQSVPDQRPAMLEVYKTLRAVGEKYGLTDDSEVLMQTEFAAANCRGD